MDEFGKRKSNLKELVIFDGWYDILVMKKCYSWRSPPLNGGLGDTLPPHLCPTSHVPRDVVWRVVHHLVEDVSYYCQKSKFFSFSVFANRTFLVIIDGTIFCDVA